MTTEVSHLEITCGDGYFGPEVRILVDGQDIFDVDGQAGYDPAVLLDTGALLPIDPPRRIAIYMCGCGCSGCGDIAPLIRRSGDRIEWVRPRRYTGAFDDAFPDEAFGPEDDDGVELDLPDLSFEADQYLSEVARARDDRAWEPPGRQVARAAADVLRSRQRELAPRGYTFKGVWAPASDNRFDVNLRSAQGQRVVGVRTSGTNDQQVAQIVDVILTTPESSWEITFTNYGPLAGRRIHPS